MGAADGVGGLVHRRFEAEGMGDEIDVVVDGFRNPDNGDVLAAPGDFLLGWTPAAFIDPSPPMTNSALTFRRSRAVGDFG